MKELKLQTPRKSASWIALCGLLLVITLSANYAVSQRVRADALPIPVNVPVPDSVSHTDAYGQSMAIDGDTLVVGAPWTAVNGAEQQGVVYIFTRNPTDPTGFSLVKSITGSDSGKLHAFGWSVALDGDTLVVGTGNNGNITFTGAAYVFERNQGGANQWGEVKKLVRGDDRFTYFGRTLAIHADTIVVGAWLGLGQVMLFQRNQDGANQWGKTQTLDGGIPVTTTPRSASFGYAIAFDGSRLVISAPKVGLKVEDVPAGTPAPARNFEGATYIYRQENGQWLREAKLFSSDTDLNNLDPVSVFGSGDAVTTLALNGDLLFVGTPFGKTNGVMTGKVFVYQQGAGTPGTFGQPGGWGEIAVLSPSDGVAKDHFGQALYAVDDGVFVSSEKQGVGKVYFYRNPTRGQASVNAATLQSPLTWNEMYSFSSSTNGSTAFGLPLVGSDNTIAIGDRAANGGRGGIATYPKAALFAADPNATPSVTPTPTATPPPTSNPCIAANFTNQVYLPIISSGASAGDGETRSASAQPVGEGTPFIGEVGPGCVITAPGGLKLGALLDTITTNVPISMAISTAPSEMFPVSMTRHGAYFALSSDRNRLLALENPFVISLPVPQGADPAHLALAYLSRGGTVLDQARSEPTWEFLEGVYDVASASFMTTLPFLRTDETTLVLVEHPDFISPANGAQLQSAGTRVGVFTVACKFFSGTGCTTATEEAVAGYLNDIYHRLTDVAGFNFIQPRLHTPISGVILQDGLSSLALVEGYSAEIVPHSNASCIDAAGYYTPASGTLTLCFDPATGINPHTVETLTHEYFHATQYAYPKVLEDETTGRIAAWVIEGMATAAEQSYFESTTMLRDLSWPLHDVELALSMGVWRDSRYEEYQAQDFWVYTGQRQSSGLAYLKSILESGGAHTSGVGAALQTKFGTPFSDLYWGWVKNQAIENQYALGDGLGERCKLNEEVLDGNVPIEFPASEIYFPFNTLSAYDTLDPLTAKVIEIKFGSKASAHITMEYQGCAGLQDPVAKASCIAAAQQTLKSKIYIEGEASCEKEELHGWRFLGELSQSNRYFVVVANADTEKEHGYFFWIE